MLKTESLSSTEMLQPYRPPRSLRSASKKLLTVPSAKLNGYGCQSFSFAAPKLWNSLPETVHNHDDLETFKTATKTYLFREHFN